MGLLLKPLHNYFISGRILLAATFSCAIFSGAHADTSMPLNGIGTYNHMGKDYYVVAHYSTLSCTQASTCEQQTSPALYSLKMLTSRWTSHSYSLVWQRELASNNGQATLPSEVMPALLEFTQLAETQLTTGDNIDIYYDGVKTLISINSAQAITAPGKSLFNYIARVWVGPIPPSRTFKAGMLAGHNGKHDTHLRYEFEASAPAPERMELLAAWQQQKAQEPAQNKTVIAAAIPPAEPIKIVEPKTAPTVKIAPAAKAAVPIAATKVAVIAPSVTATPKEVMNEPVVVQNPAPKIEPQKAVVVESNNAVIAATSSAPPKLTQEQKSALLEWQLNTAIFKNVQYPSWAKQFGQQGIVSVSFTIDSNLQKATVTTIEPKQAGLLGEAVVAAIHKSFPLDDTLKPLTSDQSLDFTYRHDFSLSRPSTAPLTPGILLNNDLIESTQVQAFLKQPGAQSITSLDDLRSYLSEKVKYPYWAKSLNLRGVVKAKITLNAQGFIDDIEIIKKSRHAEFNKAIIDAANEAAPYPIASADKKVIFEYQHTFKP